MPKTIDIQGHKLIAALIDYFEKERDNEGPLLLVNSVRGWVPSALNISVATMNNIAYKMKNNTLDSAKKNHLHTMWVTNLDHFDIGFIQDQIYEMYKNKKIVCLKSMHKRIWDMQLFEGCKTPFYTLLQETGFKWCKDNPRRDLIGTFRLP
ncbi:uncharacterized protein LOC143195866 [Rhynchophorus ferrugineus]|uniref:uncharacterized protein LOC143195866 n=1 Tax=Rhynchophorus ferrugineus TaxID=354439 RepID=UPI003FCD23BA